MRSIQERLHDILEAISQIEKYAVQGKSAFETNELIQVWIVYHLQIIGEAVRAIPDHLRNQAPHIPWRRIAGMRNIIVHTYFRIDPEVVWTVVEKHLPVLKVVIESFLEEQQSV